VADSDAAAFVLFFLGVEARGLFDDTWSGDFDEMGFCNSRERFPCFVDLDKGGIQGVGFLKHPPISSASFLLSTLLGYLPLCCHRTSVLREVRDKTRQDNPRMGFTTSPPKIR